MNKLKIFLIIIFIPVAGFGQFTIKVITDKQPLYEQDGDTLSTCRDTVITFKVETRNGTDTIFGADYFWDFDDGEENLQSGEDLDSVTHFYSEGGGYRVELIVRYEGVSKKKIIPIRIAKAPDFSQTKTDTPEEQEGVCIGGDVKLTGNAYPKKWEDEPIYEVTESPPAEISETAIYTSELKFDEFLEDAVFNAGDIDSVGLKIEHSDMGNLQVKIICPSGKEMILKHYTVGNHSTFGEPIEADTGAVGITYQYYWTPDAKETMLNVIESPLPAEAYKSHEDFSLLNGCPLNGVWQIEVSDDTPTNTGFIEAWSISFSEEAEPPMWEFVDTVTYPLYTYWNGRSIRPTSAKASEDSIIGLTIVNPEKYDKNEYSYHIRNNWNCPQDTTIEVIVTKPEIKANPSSGNAPLDVTFTCETDWVTNYEWDFGKRKDNQTTQTAEHHYPEKGKYTVILTALDDTGCEDTDTLELDIKVEPSSLDISVNVFTPNGDGRNDFFVLKDARSMEKFKFTIYTRWGAKVYQTEDTEEATTTGWDGKMPVTGFLASPGTYFFTVKAKGKDDKEYKESGSFQIFR